MNPLPARSTGTNQATHVGVAIVAVVAATTTAAVLSVRDEIPWTTLIFLGGTVGGVVNNFRRVQKLSLSGSRRSSPLTDRLVTIQIYTSPFVGGVFAIVLYGIFMSGLVQGALFPAFQETGAAFDLYPRFTELVRPATHADMAKALVWSFVAGFSEGLVPNFISKLTKDAEQELGGREAAPKPSPELD